MRRRDMPVRRDRRVHHLNRRGEEITTCLARSARQTTPPRATQSQAEDMMNCNAAVLTPVAPLPRRQARLVRDPEARWTEDQITFNDWRWPELGAQVSALRSAPKIGHRRSQNRTIQTWQANVITSQSADLRLLVGVAGFEPAAPSSRTERSGQQSSCLGMLLHVRAFG
jgi:hypothetical protein